MHQILSECWNLYCTMMNKLWVRSFQFDQFKVSTLLLHFRSWFYSSAQAAELKCQKAAEGQLHGSSVNDVESIAALWNHNPHLFPDSCTLRQQRNPLLCHGHFFAITDRLPRALSTFLLNNSALCGLRMWGVRILYALQLFAARVIYFFEFLQLEIVFAVPPSHSFQLMAAPGSHSFDFSAYLRPLSLHSASNVAPFMGGFLQVENWDLCDHHSLSFSLSFVKPIISSYFLCLI